ncbi:DinB family protein [Zhihengliuella salsuginis]|uniref:DinB family protein n=1 Tax=Zhihengliuella salsuginis TaxID=578222 RepID=UPI001676F49C|nr:DinB family protein [Zhihengliuella salsuginis]
METQTLERAYDAFLATAERVVAERDVSRPGDDGGWSAEQVLAHVALVDAATLEAAARIAAGGRAVYDNRVSLDASTIGATIAAAGGAAGLIERIRSQGAALGLLVGSVLSDPELARKVPALLVSGDDVVLDATLTLEEIVGGLAADHLPRHGEQLEAAGA